MGAGYPGQVPARHRVGEVRRETLAGKSRAPAFELREVTKSFGSVRVLSPGSLWVDAGSIHALVGENGAGKSTLVKVVAGVHRRDSGDLLLDGQSVAFGSTAESKAAGVAVIYQEPTLFPDLSVTWNIFMGRQDDPPTSSGTRSGSRCAFYFSFCAQ